MAKQKPAKNEHGNSKFSQTLRKDIIAIIKNDVPVEKACSYCGITKDTFYRRIKEDPELSDDYARAKDFMHVITSNVIATTITDKSVDKEVRAKYALERKKRRDKRYMDKNKLFGDADNPLQVIVKKIGQKEEPKEEEEE